MALKVLFYQLIKFSKRFFIESLRVKGSERMEASVEVSPHSVEYTLCGAFDQQSAAVGTEEFSGAGNVGGYDRLAQNQSLHDDHWQPLVN